LILYVNGDSHSAGAEAVNRHCFAEDDTIYRKLGRIPHPDNLAVSYGQKIANALNYDLTCQAESGGSNQRVFRTTNSFLEHTTPDLIIIGWATWEREEVLIDDVYYQFSAHMNPRFFPANVAKIYKEWVVSRECHVPYCNQTQMQIWDLHQKLISKNIPHLFFNTYSNLTVDNNLEWGNSYLNPYQLEFTYYNWLKKQGFKPQYNPNNHHYGADAHQAWANHLTKIINESIITK
jgi:hypothetical protein